jgi:hypothetical protein
VIRKISGAALAAAVATLAVIAGAGAATPSAATMTLQLTDVAGAKARHAGSVTEKGYLAAYEREFTVTPAFGAGKIVYLDNEVAVAASADQPTRDIAAAQKEFRSTAGRAALAAGLAKTLQVKKSAVTIGTLRGVPGYDQGIELPISVKTKIGRLYQNLALLRLDRVFVVLGELGARPISRADTAKLAGLIAAHVTAALTPVNVAAPTVTGTPQQGQTLTASTGNWNVDDVAFTYQWQHCDATGANCADIPGATQSTYLVGSADVGLTLRVNVTATDRFGAPVAPSATTAAVT